MKYHTLLASLLVAAAVVPATAGPGGQSANPNLGHSVNFSSVQTGTKGILLAGTRAGNFTSSSTSVALPLDDAGDTALTFSTSINNQRVLISYNAECAAVGPVGAWTSVTVTVDGVEANPASGSSFAMCTSSVDSGHTWTGAVRQSWIKIPSAGLHTISVTGALANGETSMWFGDSSLVIFNFS